MRRQTGLRDGRGAAGGAGARTRARKRGAADGMWPGAAPVTRGLCN